MSGWALGVEVSGPELVVARIDGSDPHGVATLLDEPSAASSPGADTDAGVDATADRLASAARAGGGDPARLIVVTPSDTAVRRFEELSEAAALSGLPAPYWLPTPVAIAGVRLAQAVAVGAAALVLDARRSEIVAWPVWRTPEGAEVGGSGPIATGLRLDQLLAGVARAKLREVAPALAARVDDVADPAGRAEAARLRRELRRARSRLADDDVEQATLPAGGDGGPGVVLERAVFSQLVAHALRETLRAVHAAHPVTTTIVVAHRRTPLAVELAERTAGEIVAAGGVGVALRGAAALVTPGSRAGAIAPSPAVDPAPPTAAPAVPPPAVPPSAATAAAAAIRSGTPPAAPGASPPPTLPPPAVPAETAASRDQPVPDDAWPDAWAGAWPSTPPPAREATSVATSAPVGGANGGPSRPVAPAPPTGTRPAGANNSRPAGADGTRPAGSDGTRTAGADGTRPVGADGTRPTGADGTRPVGADGTRPTGADGTRPTGADGTRPAGTGVADTGGPHGAWSAAHTENRPASSPTPVRATPPRRPRRRPRWAVPVLSALLVIVVLGAVGVLVLGPRFVADPVTGPAVPAPVATPAVPQAPH